MEIHMANTMTRRERQEQQMREVDAVLTPKQLIVVRLNRIMEAGLLFHERLWSEDEKTKGEVIKELRENPERFHARERSFGLFFTKVLPTKILHQSSPSNNKRVTADQLESAGLSSEDIKKLAGLNGDGPEKPEEPGLDGQDFLAVQEEIAQEEEIEGNVSGD